MRREKEEMMTVYKFRRKLKNQNADAMVVVNSAEYGFIWYGKVKFMFSNFMPDFFRKKIVSMEQRQGHVAITV